MVNNDHDGASAAFSCGTVSPLHLAIGAHSNKSSLMVCCSKSAIPRQRRNSGSQRNDAMCQKQTGKMLQGTPYQLGCRRTLYGGGVGMIRLYKLSENALAPVAPGRLAKEDMIEGWIAEQPELSG